MTEILSNEEQLEHLILCFNNFVWTEQEKNEVDNMRADFVNFYDKTKLENLKYTEYFAGLGLKQGCIAYDLEWGTRILGSIKGGSKYKYGYETDFEKIKKLLIKVTSIDSKIAYTENGCISNELKQIVELSKEINGFKTGRTVMPKILSIYFPFTFLPIFNDQDRFIELLIINGLDTENSGLELYLEYNYKLLKIKEKVEAVSGRKLGSYEFARLLYTVFPKELKEIIDGQPIIIQENKEEQIFEALEVQHYQTLLHRNRQRLFPNLKYFDIEQQMAKNGQYDTQVVGIMDMLTIDENGNFVIIEIKRKAKDLSIGQILRYMGWTKEELCKSGQSVRGLIVAESKDINLEFALKIVPEVKFLKLNLNITLIEQ